MSNVGGILDKMGFSCCNKPKQPLDVVHPFILSVHVPFAKASG